MWASLARGLIILGVAWAAAAAPAGAQDLEPRAFANTPVGLNFLIGGYAYADGTVGTDAAVPLEDTEVQVDTAALAYVRTLDLWGRSGKVDVILPYGWAFGSTKFAGQEKRRDVSGLADPRFRVSTLLLGGPALSLEEFRDFKPDWIVGVSFEVTVPLGEYDSDKLLNIGTNRWSFKPELGISKTIEPFTLELTTGVRFYTENDDFFGGKTLALSPLYSVQMHAIYSFTPGLWLGLDGVYYTGAQPTISGRRGESEENARIGLTCTLPVNAHNAVKVYGSTGLYSKTGTDFDMIGINWQFRWGAGL
ncbi:MAG: transporter [Rhodospirillales bacterium]